MNFIHSEQNLNELPQLAGLEDDLAFKQEIETQVGFYKAARSVMSLVIY